MNNSLIYLFINWYYYRESEWVGHLSLWVGLGAHKPTPFDFVQSRTFKYLKTAYNELLSDQHVSLYLNQFILSSPYNKPLK